MVECLSKPEHAASVEASDACRPWLALMTACADDLTGAGTCAGQTDDAFLCLTAWNARDRFSDECVAAMPAPIVREKTAKELAKEQAKKNGKGSRADRLRREHAAYNAMKAKEEKMAEVQQARAAQEEASKKARRKKRQKAKRAKVQAQAAKKSEEAARKQPKKAEL